MASEGVSEGPFAGAGAAPGLEIWRIEDFAPAPVEKAFHGQFYVGDSYVLLFTRRTSRGALVYNIHFWLGAETSVDERGSAAKFAVKLDDGLGGSPKEYREVQGHESDLFLSYFRANGGVEYLPGGTASGFRHVVPEEHPPRLLHIKGRVNVRMNQVPLGVASLNKGDVYILDLGATIFTWFGDDSNRKEQARGLQVASRLRSSRSGTTNCILLKGNDDHEEFWSVLGGTYDDVASADPESDRAADKDGGSAVTLHHFSVDDDGNVSTDAIERVDGHYTSSMLDHESTYFLATPQQLYVWIGKRSPAHLRKEALKHGGSFLASAGLPDYLQISREIDGGETAVFKEYFHVFDPPVSLSVADRIAAAGSGEAKAEAAADGEVSVTFLPGQAPSERMVDDGSGTLTIWRVEGMALVEVPKELYGQFFAGDAYVLQYDYTNSRGRADCLVYFWQGRKAGVDEKAASAIEAVKISNRHNHAPQIRVVQGKEPAHFCALFKGRMIVHSGGVAGHFAKLDGETDEDLSTVRLYHVKGTSEAATKATQVAAKATSLNSSDCYVLVTESSVFAWSGRDSSESERSTAGAIAEVLRGEQSVVPVAEGEEDDTFWAALGGQAEYPSESVGGVPGREPRMFQVTATGGGSVDAMEIFNFTQDDLDTSDVFIVDCYTQLFVWVGHGANAEEREGGVKTAQAFVDSVADGRDPDTPIIQVEQGAEPDMFTANFLGWDHEAAATFVDPYERRLQELKAATEASGGSFLANARSRLRKTDGDGKREEGADEGGFVDPLERRRREKEAAAASAGEGNFLQQARAGLRKTNRAPE